MDEAEAFRHRWRVVGFAVLAAVIAGGLNGCVAANGKPVLENPSLHLIRIAPPYFHCRWIGPWFDSRASVVPPAWAGRHQVNVQRAAAAAAVIAGIGVAFGGILVQLPHTRLTTTWPQLLSWVAVWFVPSVLAQTAGTIIRELETKRGFIEPGFTAGFWVAVIGTAGGVAWWIVPCAVFRGLTLADWWPTRKACLRFGFVLTAGSVTCVVFAADIASLEPIDLSHWVEGKWDLPSGLPGEIKSVGMEPVYADERQRKAFEQASVASMVAAKQADLRALNVWRAVPVGVLTAAVIMLAPAFLNLRRSRIRYPLWLVAWVVAGAVGSAVAVREHGDLWHLFARDGTPFGEHLTGMMLRGAAIGLAGGIVMLVADAATGWMFGARRSEPPPAHPE